MQRLIFILLRLTLFLFVLNCDVPEDKTESKDNINLGYAIGFKANECGNYPNYPLFIASGSAKDHPTKMSIYGLSLLLSKDI